MKLKITYLFLFGGTLVSTQQFLPVFFQFFPPILKTKPNKNSDMSVISKQFWEIFPLPDFIVFTNPIENKQHINQCYNAFDFTEDEYSLKYHVSSHLSVQVICI